MDLHQQNKGAAQLDSHADTSVVGSDFVMLDDPESVTEHVNLAPLSDDNEPMKGIPVASCATAWVNPFNGRTYILVLHQILYFGERLWHSLTCPNQVRDHGNIVEDTPKRYDISSNHGVTLIIYSTRSFRSYFLY